MLTEKINEALNQQLNAELYSSYIYLSMSAFCETRNLKGMAHWFRIQAQEELVHVMKFFAYVNDRGGRVQLAGVEAPPVSWGSPLEAFEGALAHERLITSRITDLVSLAQEERDRLTDNFLQWFVGEQVEEEASVDEIVSQLKLVGDNGSGLFMIDRELSQRVFTPPPGFTL